MRNANGQSGKWRCFVIVFRGSRPVLRNRSIARGCIERIPSRDNLQCECGIVDASPEDADLVERRGKRHQATAAHATIGWLDADHTTEGGRLSHRPTGFRSKRNAHETSGKAELLKVGEKNVLRLSGFTTSNGPAVRVYLVKASDPSDMSVKEKGFVDLGPIKGNVGDQNYELPEGVDLSQYGAVSIWCARFGVNFGGASLSRA